MRIILITGGSRGIGAGAALECASRGFGVVLTYKTNPEAAAAVVRRIEDAGRRCKKPCTHAGAPGACTAW
jgi:NAD(P)-dependent dehydrogenase (short-subunit alcohol dehydrogenase family)